VFRDFITDLAATAGVQLPDRSVPEPVAAAIAVGGETVWRALRLPGRPPVTRMAFWLTAHEATFDISLARQELGYTPVRTVPDGMAELRELARAGTT
jgi:nucleoside-diphosphate-sugar epimerase